jgi:RNA polymerase sigma-70 factor (ECF subfamily)
MDPAVTAPEQDVSEQQDEAAMLHALLEQLPPRDRLVLTLLHIEERSVAETAQMVGWSQVMVKVQAFRARKKLRDLWQRRVS